MMRKSALLVAVGAIVLALVSSAPSYAVPLGGRYVRPKSAFNLPYIYHGSAYTSNVSQGASNWNVLPTYVNITAWYTPLVVNIDVYDSYNSATWWGIAYFNPCAGPGCNYQRNYYYLNTRTLASESSFTRTKVATHEFGHTIGLAHAPNSETSIMKQGHLSYNTPRLYDAADLFNIYH